MELALKSYQQLKMFIKDTLIPLAIENKAIIITSGLNDCSLASAVSSMADD